MFIQQLRDIIQKHQPYCVARVLFVLCYFHLWPVFEKIFQSKKTKLARVRYLIR